MFDTKDSGLLRTRWYSVVMFTTIIGVVPTPTVLECPVMGLEFLVTGFSVKIETEGRDPIPTVCQL